MRWIQLGSFLLALLVTQETALGAKSNQTSLSPAQELEQLFEVSRKLPVSVRAGILINRYRHLFPDSGLASLSERNLRQRFNAAEIVAFYSYDAATAREIERLYKALEAQEAATEADRRVVVGSYILVRDFERAREFVNSIHPESGREIPDVRDISDPRSSAPTVLRLHGSYLVRENLPLDPAGAEIIVVVSPLCHFSTSAIDAINRDPVLRDTFLEAFWVVPPARSLQLDAVTAWNNSHPNQQMVLAHTPNEWPLLDDWSTPVFYFVNHGKLVAKVIGWPSDGSRRDELLHALDKWRNTQIERTKKYRRRQ